MKKLIEAHKFFIRESKLFVGKPKYDWIKEFEKNGTHGNLRHDVAKNYKYDLKDKIYFPIAYVKFMWATLLDK